MLRILCVRSLEVVIFQSDCLFFCWTDSSRFEAYGFIKRSRIAIAGYAVYSELEYWFEGVQKHGLDGLNG